MLDWLIVGGGIHGTALSFYLTRVKGVPRDSVRVLDPHEEPLKLWNTFTRNTGMDYLRSPHVQSLDRDPWSISTFARTRAGQPLARFIPTHNRPSLALFQAHCDWMINHHRLASMRVQGRADGLTRIAGGWRVESDRGALEARRVVIAIGATEQPHWPGWAQRLRGEKAAINHIFEPAFDRDALPDWKHLVVVGGGITAAQVSLALAERHPGRVTLVMRHAPRVVPFDSDLCWAGIDCVRRFRQVADYAERRRMIRAARYRGSMPADVHCALQAATAAGHVTLVQSEIVDACLDGAGGFQLILRDGSRLAADRILLATGFDTARPGGAWIDRAIADHGLPVAPCGFPIVDPSLAWAPGLHTSGPLAELEVGAASRNIIGARLAAEKIAASL